MTKLIILVKTCYNIVCHSRSYKYCLASADIKPFGHACLFAMLLLIDPALFTPQVFLFSIIVHTKRKCQINGFHTCMHKITCRVSNQKIDLLH